MAMEEATYNLLVVDDEEIAVRGIEHGIDWSRLPGGGHFHSLRCGGSPAGIQG